MFNKAVVCDQGSSLVRLFSQINLSDLCNDDVEVCDDENYDSEQDSEDGDDLYTEAHTSKDNSSTDLNTSVVDEPSQAEIITFDAVESELDNNDYK